MFHDRINVAYDFENAIQLYTVCVTFVCNKYKIIQTNPLTDEQHFYAVAF